MRKLILVILMGSFSVLASTNVVISKYYDGRTCAVMFMVDDYKNGNQGTFTNAMIHARTNHVNITVGVMTEQNDVNSWGILQDQLDLGHVSIASHARASGDPDDWTDVTAEVTVSTASLITNLNLLEHTKYDGTEHVVAWVQPYGTTIFQDQVRATLSTNNYLCDRSTTGGERDYQPWDDGIGDKGLFDRVNSESGGTVAYQEGLFDSAYAAGGVYSFYSHPATEDMADPSNRNHQVCNYIGGKKDVWYAGFDELYMYRYAATEAGLSIICTEETHTATLSVSCPEIERDKYALSFPLTYVYTNGTGAASSGLNAYYKGQMDTEWTLLPEIDTNDFYVAQDALRKEGDIFYISAALPQTGTNFAIKVASRNPVRFRPDEGERLLIQIGGN